MWVIIKKGWGGVVVVIVVVVVAEVGVLLLDIIRIDPWAVIVKEDMEWEVDANCWMG